MKNTKFKNLSKSDKAITLFGNLLLAVLVLLIIVPLIYIVVASFMDPVALSNEGISFDFSKWSLQGYSRVFQDDMILRGFINSVLYSFGFAVISVAVTLMAAYPLSRKDLVGKKFINMLFIITMFFGGGLMPTYLLMQNLKLMNMMGYFG